MAKDHVLPNGYTFMAITTGYQGTWAKATDPVTAARNAAKAYSPSAKIAVQVFYGKSDDMKCAHSGGILWTDTPPIAIGLFLVSKTIIKPMPKGAFNADHQSHDEWMATMIERAEADAKAA